MLGVTKFFKKQGGMEGDEIVKVCVKVDKVMKQGKGFGALPNVRKFSNSGIYFVCFGVY